MREKIEKIIENLRRQVGHWSPEERAVMRLLYQRWQHDDGTIRKITQSEISESEEWLGSHPKHEGYMSNQTTLRKVRQIIRDLRVNRGAPIISDREGYWIPTRKDQIDEYIERIEITAKAQAAAWFETYRAMDRVLGVKSEYFESQQKFFHE